MTPPIYQTGMHFWRADRACRVRSFAQRSTAHLRRIREHGRSIVSQVNGGRW